MTVTVPLDPRTRSALAVLTALALALRVACAQGGLWLDEAWSAILAHDVGTPAGVFFGINHDNNHHLNSLWLQALGPGAPPWAMRAPSIAAGTLAIPVAAMLAAPRGRTATLVTALLFAVSPMLVTLGSEARGYAPMALALLVACLFVDRTLAGEDRYHCPVTLALCFAIGALFQLTMVFGVAALCGWAFVTWWQRGSFGDAIRRSLALFAVPLAALGVVLAMIAVAAWASPTGFRFGSYDPFTLPAYRGAIVDMVGYTIGLPVATILLPLAAVALAVSVPRAATSRAAFYRLAIIAFPATIAILQTANPGYPRYYLVASIALLLLLGETIAHGLETPGFRRSIAAVALAAITIGSVVQDVRLATNRRGDPSVAVRALAARAPPGSTVAIDRSSGRAVLQVAAVQAGYPLRIATEICPARSFLFVDRAKGEAPSPQVTRCTATYRPIAGAEPVGLSGTPWTLYARVP